MRDIYYLPGDAAVLSNDLQVAILSHLRFPGYLESIHKIAEERMRAIVEEMSRLNEELERTPGTEVDRRDNCSKQRFKLFHDIEDNHRFAYNDVVVSKIIWGEIGIPPNVILFRPRR